MVGPAGPQAVRQCDVAIEMTRVNRTDRGQLMEDHVRPRPRHGLRNLIGLSASATTGTAPSSRSIACFDSLRVMP